MTYHPTALVGDGKDYDLLYRAAQRIKGVPGLTCEIGLREGGGTETIIRGCQDNGDQRVHVAIDPFGNVGYPVGEGLYKIDYTNEMKRRTLALLFCLGFDLKQEILYFPLSDIDFFLRFHDGVPVYNEDRTLVNEYALVFFDGPHSVKAVTMETQFFVRRSCTGAMFVYDNVDDYDHDGIHKFLVNVGFEEVDRAGVKVAYRRM